jgi:acyl-CoA thioesterase-1
MDRRRARRQAAVAAIGGIALATAVVAVGSPGAASSAAASCARTAARSAERAAVVTGSGPRVGVIGDSYAQGLGLSRPQDSWPSRLPGRVRVDGFAGSGFSAQASPCRGEDYAARVPRVLAGDPDLVVVEGGLNEFDVPTAAVVAGADRTLDALAGHRVLLVGPTSAPARADQMSRVDRALAAVAGRHGVRYVRATGWDLAYLHDGLHLAEAGHREFGDHVAAVAGPMLEQAGPG